MHLERASRRKLNNLSIVSSVPVAQVYLSLQDAAARLPESYAICSLCVYHVRLPENAKHSPRRVGSSNGCLPNISSDANSERLTSSVVHGVVIEHRVAVDGNRRTP